MAFQFPADPVLDQTFSPAGGPTYRWNGMGWMPISPTYGGGLTFNGPVLFADGTLAAPSITWANETTMGFYRSGAKTVQSVVDGVAIFGWDNLGFTLPNTKSILGKNLAGASLSAIHIGGDDRLHLGYGWPETIIDSSGSTRLHVHTGGVSLYGTVTGVSAAMVGLPNVTNNRQVYEYRNGANAIYIGWDGGAMDCQVDSTGYGRKWPIDIRGVSRGLWQNADINGIAMYFHWAGQGGQPSWLWGSNDGNNHYVWNPSNFSVNYANYSNAAQGVYNGGGGPGSTRFVFHWHDPGWHPNYVWGSSDGTNFYVFPPSRFNVNSASSAGYANNSGQVNGVGNWSYSNYSNNPTYVWATNGDTQHQFLCHVPSMSVNYANSCNYANVAGSVSGGGAGVSNIYIPSTGATLTGSVAMVGNDATGVYNDGNTIIITSHDSIGGGGTDGLRAKDNIAASTTNATAAISAVDIIEFDDKLRDVHVSTGFLPANLETIDSDMVYRTVFPGDPFDGPKDTLNVNPIMVLAYLVKALQETITRIDQLEAK